MIIYFFTPLHSVTPPGENSKNAFEYGGGSLTVTELEMGHSLSRVFFRANYRLPSDVFFFLLLAASASVAGTPRFYAE